MMINWKIIARENLEHFFVISSIHLRKQTPNKIPEQFYSKSSLKTFSPLQKSITFSFSLNELMGQEFRTREILGTDSTNLQLDTTKQEQEGGVRWPRGCTLEVNQLIGGNFRGKSGNLTLSCVCSAESRRETLPRRWKQKYLWPEWGGGREIKKKKKKKGGGVDGSKTRGGGRTTIAVDIRASFGGRRRRKTAGVVAVDDDSSGANELRPGKNNKSGNLVSESPVELS